MAYDIAFAAAQSIVTVGYCISDLTLVVGLINILSIVKQNEKIISAEVILEVGCMILLIFLVICPGSPLGRHNQSIRLSGCRYRSFL